MENSNILSIHIPKTGGSRFRKILRDIYGDKLFLDYYDKVLSPPVGIDFYIEKIIKLLIV